MKFCLWTKLYCILYIWAPLFDGMKCSEAKRIDVKVYVWCFSLHCVLFLAYVAVSMEPVVSALADCLGSGGDAFAFRTITGYSRLTHFLLKNVGRYARPWMSLRRSITPPLRFKTEMKKRGCHTRSVNLSLCTFFIRQQRMGKDKNVWSKIHL